MRKKTFFKICFIVLFLMIWNNSTSGDRNHQESVSKTKVEATTEKTTKQTTQQKTEQAVTTEKPVEKLPEKEFEIGKPAFGKLPNHTKEIQSDDYTKEEKYKRIIDTMISYSYYMNEGGTNREKVRSQMRGIWPVYEEYLTSIAGRDFAIDSLEGYGSLEDYYNYMDPPFDPDLDPNLQDDLDDDVVAYIYTYSDSKKRKDKEADRASLYYIAFKDEMGAQELRYGKKALTFIKSVKEFDYLLEYELNNFQRVMKAVTKYSPWYQDDPKFRKKFDSYQKEYKKIYKKLRYDYDHDGDSDDKEDDEDSITIKGNMSGHVGGSSKSKKNTSSKKQYKKDKDPESYDKEGFYEDNKDIYDNYDDAADDFDDDEDYWDDY